MQAFENLKGKKIHTRDIDIATYECGDEKIIVEGKLKDDRLITSYPISGQTRHPGAVHNMTIQMLIECSTITIQEMHVEMPCVPHEECVETSEGLSKIKGLKISPGFTSNVKRALGGKRGCLHLTTLVLAMAPAIIQGIWVHRNRKPGENKMSPDFLDTYLIDTCWVWRKEGPLSNELLKELEK